MHATVRAMRNVADISQPRSPRLLLAIACLLLAATACDSSAKRTKDGTSSARSSSGIDLTGAGATFPYPIYSRWFAEYAAKTGVKINYQDIGSGGGIKQLSEQTVDFGASDAPMTDEEMVNAAGGRVTSPLSSALSPLRTTFPISRSHFG